MTILPFAQPSALAAPAPPERVFGQVFNGRYHMPLLPGEVGPKNGAQHVSRGVMRMTNVAGAGEDTRALSVHEQAMGLIGLALAPELYEELVNVVHQARSEGVAFERLREYPKLKEILAGAPHDQNTQAASIIGRAKKVAKYDAPATLGTNRHMAWEHFCVTGELIGTQDVQESTLRTASLLAEAGLELVPGLQERVVRNTVLNAAGKFDNILLERATGRLLIADLKTKAKAFFSWWSVDTQLAGYARSEWMLTSDGQHYEPGPLEYVDQTEGVIMHVPSDGAPARLERADLVDGWERALLDIQVIEKRTESRSAGRFARSEWVPKNLAETS